MDTEVGGSFGLKQSSRDGGEIKLWAAMSYGKMLRKELVMEISLTA